MPYSELMVAPMRKELTQFGVEELRAPDDVDAFLDDAADETAMIIVNSVCGCSAGSLRPGVGTALEGDARPKTMATVFAGQDLEATERAREHFTGYPPSSPAVALFKGGELVFMMQREDIQGRQPQAIASDLGAAFEEHCAVR